MRRSQYRGGLCAVVGQVSHARRAGDAGQAVPWHAIHRVSLAKLGIALRSISQVSQVHLARFKRKLAPPSRGVLVGKGGRKEVKIIKITLPLGSGSSGAAVALYQPNRSTPVGGGVFYSWSNYPRAPCWA